MENQQIFKKYLGYLKIKKNILFVYICYPQMPRLNFFLFSIFQQIYLRSLHFFIFPTRFPSLVFSSNVVMEHLFFSVIYFTNIQFGKLYIVAIILSVYMETLSLSSILSCITWICIEEKKDLDMDSVQNQQKVYKVCWFVQNKNLHFYKPFS